MLLAPVPATDCADRGGLDDHPASSPTSRAT
jgi:hypothetical protein